MGKRIGRREALGALGGVSLGAFLAACSGGGSSSSGMSPSSTKPESTTTTGAGSAATSTDGSLTALFDDSATCSVTPGETEGPFYLDVEKFRRDITEGTDGAPLRLALRVRDAGDCTPIKDAVVDIWHADPSGDYSGVQGQDGTFLRGMQVTDADGITQFDTVYPGAYQGRTVHIHAKVHLDNSTALTTQLYFDDDLTDQVVDQSPYAGGDGRTRNDDDSLFLEQTVLTITPDEDGHLGVMTFDVRS
jgi:protocatechuate 3,4-dioxygenase beta subunit